MARAPERISSVAGTCWAAARPSASRMRASTSAGPAVSSTTSSRPQSAATAASPPSETTASSGAEAPVVRSTRLVARAAIRSRRASRITRSAGGASTSTAASSGRTRTVCPSKPSVGSTSADEPGELVNRSSVATRNTFRARNLELGDAARRGITRQNSVVLREQETAVSCPALVAAAEEMTLLTADGEWLAARHLPRVMVDAPTEDSFDIGVVVAHGFTGSIDKPGVLAVCAAITQHAGVLAFDFRGHGRSTGHSTLGDREIADLEAAVQAMRQVGYRRIVTCGWSMGGSVVLRHAALVGGADAVVSVSAVSRWFYRGTKPMRRLHWAIESRTGRVLTRRVLRTRVSAEGWPVLPEAPVEVVGRIS